LIFLVDNYTLTKTHRFKYCVEADGYLIKLITGHEFFGAV